MRRRCQPAAAQPHPGCARRPMRTASMSDQNGTDGSRRAWKRSVQLAPQQSAVAAMQSGTSWSAACPSHSGSEPPPPTAAASVRLEPAGRSLSTAGCHAHADEIAARHKVGLRVRERATLRRRRMSVAHHCGSPMSAEREAPPAVRAGHRRPRRSATAARCRIDDRGAVLRSRPCCGTNRSGAQPLPALASASVHNCSARAGGHAMAEAMACGLVCGYVVDTCASRCSLLEVQAAGRPARMRCGGRSVPRVSTREHGQPTGVGPLRCAERQTIPHIAGAPSAREGGRRSRSAPVSCLPHTGDSSPHRGSRFRCHPLVMRVLGAGRRTVEPLSTRTSRRHSITRLQQCRARP